jgi:hypothetical protein
VGPNGCPPCCMGGHCPPGLGPGALPKGFAGKPPIPGWPCGLNPGGPCGGPIPKLGCANGSDPNTAPKPG